MKPLPKSLEESHGPLKALYERHNELILRHAAKTKERVEISQRIRDNPSLGNVETNRLNRLLNRPTEPDVAPDVERLPIIVADIELLNHALAEIDRAIQKEKANASRLLCESVASEHTKLVKEFANRLIELQGAHDRYVKFLDAVENTGASLTPLRPVSPYTLGHPRSTNGSYWWSLTEFADNGHITRRDFPESLR